MDRIAAVADGFDNSVATGSHANFPLDFQYY
jgi:hypothetical protein